MSEQPSPELSIIIVAYNSLDDLKRCLPSVYQPANLPASLELIIVDNYGRDGLENWLSIAYPSVKYILNAANTGYSGGNNLGLAQATGYWTFLLNPDTELAPDCIDRLLEAARSHPDALINPKLLNPDGTINACGNEMQYTGVTTCRGLNKPSIRYTNLQEVPLLSGAALLTRTQILRDLGGFDKTYFMYFEDTDLSLRARLSGFQLLCEPAAVLTHFYKLGLSPTKFYYLERNRLITLKRVLQPETYRQLRPALFLTELFMWAFALRGWSYLRTRCQTYTYLRKNRFQIQEGHLAIQRTRCITDAELLTDSLIELPFDQLIGGSLGKLANTITRPLYVLLRPKALQSTAHSVPAPNPINQ